MATIHLVRGSGEQEQNKGQSIHVYYGLHRVTSVLIARRHNRFWRGLDPFIDYLFRLLIDCRLARWFGVDDERVLQRVRQRPTSWPIKRLVHPLK